jgi:hypothetical protein
VNKRRSGSQTHLNFDLHLTSPFKLDMYCTEYEHDYYGCTVLLVCEYEKVVSMQKKKYISALRP